MNIRVKTIEISGIFQEIRNTLLVLAGAAFLPVIIHLIPPNGFVPVGAILVPMFYAPFLAIGLYKKRTGIIAGLLAPAVNALITGKPVMAFAGQMTIELTLFTLIAAFLYSRWKGAIVTAPFSYIFAIFIVRAVGGMTPYFINDAGTGAVFMNSVKIALPGILMLFLINFFVVEYNKRVK